MRDDHFKEFSRRDFVRQILGAGGCLSFANHAFSQQKSREASGTNTGSNSLSDVDDQFLNELEKANVQYFWEQANPKTGLVKDRCNVHADDGGVVGSIAATGFGLTALCIGEKRGFISHSDAQERVLATFESLWAKLPNHRGFFYHWANINTGERVWDAEVSSVDTTILLCGVLVCREYFPAAEVQGLADAIFDRVEWTWLSYLLGLGSTSHPLPEEAWAAWKRLTFEYAGLRYIGSFAPLFVHQYSQAWFDFRGKRDKYADYFRNSAIATDVHRRFCLELAKQFPSYSEDLWGITASDSPKGYVIWGGPPSVGPSDGTIAPSASAGSLPFLPEPVMRVLRTIKDKYPSAWSKYGFVNAFNPLTKWYDADVIGIDTGITLLMAENFRSGFVWNTFMKNEAARRGMQRAGFKKYQT